MKNYISFLFITQSYLNSNVVMMNRHQIQGIDVCLYSGILFGGNSYACPIRHDGLSTLFQGKGPHVDMK